MHRKNASRVRAQSEATMIIDKLTPETKLRRKAVAEASTAHGFPIKEKTLATMASRGGGPPFQLWGRIPIYTWGIFFDWAPSRPSEPPRSTAGTDAQPSPPGRHSHPQARSPQRASGSAA